MKNNTTLIFVVLGLILFVNAIRLNDHIQMVLSLVFICCSEITEHLVQRKASILAKTAKKDTKTVIDLTNRVEALEISSSFRGQ